MTTVDCPYARWHLSDTEEYLPLVYSAAESPMFYFAPANATAGSIWQVPTDKKYTPLYIHALHPSPQAPILNSVPDTTEIQAIHGSTTSTVAACRQRFFQLRPAGVSDPPNTFNSWIDAYWLWDVVPTSFEEETLSFPAGTALRAHSTSTTWSLIIHGVLSNA